MRSYIRRCVLAFSGLDLLAAPITVAGGTLEHRHSPLELAASPIHQLDVGVRVAG
jgi:hypothetical protein